MGYAKFNSEFESVEKKWKKAHIQNYRPHFFALIIYNQKLNFSVTFLLLIFFLISYIATFPTDSKSASKSLYFLCILYFARNIFLSYSISTFYKLWKQMRTK